jgi:PEP-CTERM motif
LGNHPAWSLQSITFGDVMMTPGEQVEFWFNNDATQSAAISDKHDDTILQLGSNVCVGGIGANGSCLFNFSALSVNPDIYQYLWATAVNPNSDNANLQPAILFNQLTGTTDPIPEPASLPVLGVSLVIFAAAWRRRIAA